MDDYMKEMWEASLKVAKFFEEGQYTDKDGVVWLGVEGDSQEEDRWVQQYGTSISSAEMQKKMGYELLGWDETPVEDPYEYAIQAYQDDTGKWVVSGKFLAYGFDDHWDTLEEREGYLSELKEDYPERTFRIVKRRKAGRIEHV